MSVVSAPPSPVAETPDVPTLRAALADRATYPDGVGQITLVETHLSLVGLGEGHVWKVKKPLDLGFVDFTDPGKRAAACEAEVRLNRRLAPDVYEGLVPLVRTPEGRLRLEGAGRPVAWAVKMKRLDDAARLSEQLDRVSPDTMARLGQHIARFHRQADRGPHVARWATAAAVRELVDENRRQTRDHIGETVHAQVWHRLDRRFAETLATREGLMDRRAHGGVPRETHGDLRLEHVYLVPAGGFTILDAVEFSERYRHADPVADVAFLVMELRLADRPGLARAFFEAWVEAASDPEARRLLPLYEAYRAVVRAKVHGLQALDPERPPEARDGARHTAQRHWLHALGVLAPPARRPALLLMGGLPGVGKSTVARALATAAGVTVLRSDVIRKELAGIDPHASAAAPFGAGLYTPEHTARTYAALREEARRRLLRGERILLDASFRTEEERRAALALGPELGVPAWSIRLEVPRAVALSRIAGREGGPSDADARIHDAARARWEPESPEVGARTVAVDASGPCPRTRDHILAFLARKGLGDRPALRGPGP